MPYPQINSSTRQAWYDLGRAGAIKKPGKKKSSAIPTPGMKTLAAPSQQQPVDGELLRSFQRTLTQPMEQPSIWNPPDPTPELVGFKPTVPPVPRGRPLPQTTFPMAPKQFADDTEPNDPTPMVMPYWLARARGFVDPNRPIEYVKPLTEPRQPDAMAARDIRGPTKMTGPGEWNQYPQPRPRFPVAPSAANAITPLTQPTTPEQWQFGPGWYRRYQQQLGIDLNQPPPPMSADDLREVQGIVSQSPARQERLATAMGARPTVFVDGQGYMPLGGSGTRSTSGVSAGRTPFPGSRVGVGRMSNAVTTGGTFGSGLMLGAGPAAQQRPEITSRPMIGGQQVSPSEFQQAWSKQQNAPRTAPDANPERVAANKAAMRRMRGGAPIVTDPAQRQAMWDAERARKEMTKAGFPRDFARAWAANLDNPEVQAAMVEAMRRPLVARGTRGGWDEDGRGAGGIAGVVAAQTAAQALASDRKMKQDEFDLDKRMKVGEQSRADYNAAVAGGMTPLEAEQYVQQSDPSFKAPIPPAMREEQTVSGLPTEPGSAAATAGPSPIRGSAALTSAQATAISGAKTEHQARAYLASIGITDRATQDATLRTYYFGRGGGIGRMIEAFGSPTVPPPTSSFPRMW